jgi:SAM-dependent methyltransferase
MTPIEVVDAMVDIAISDILKDPESKKNLLSAQKDSFIVLDPTCGVGTFITRAAERIEARIRQQNISSPEKIIKNLQDYSYKGQDKVDRMVRLAKINSLFSGINPNNLFQGNSILGASNITGLVGKVDLILTNPPFGAEFASAELDLQGQHEILSRIENLVGTRTLNSELIMLDKSLRLLKPGGRLLIVVPDGVVSGSGMYQLYRESLLKEFILKAVIDLPAVTFAQAGTRTKCSVVYIQKPRRASEERRSIFMGVVRDIGYEVKERMGAPVKDYSGVNHFSHIADSYALNNPPREIKIVSEDPSIVWYPHASLIASKWNANFYAADRIKVLNKFSEIDSKELEIKALKDIARSVTKERDRIPVSTGVKCISVLHVKDDSTIQVEEVLKYAPLYPGNECLPREILFSKINPRIPRVAVLPDIGFKLTCSTEFEILKPIEEKYTYLLRVFLLTELVQKQINSLTSGTSSSHNRIKEAELMNVQLPWPKKGSKTEKELLALAKIIEEEEKKKYESTRLSRETIKKIQGLVGI